MSNEQRDVRVQKAREMQETGVKPYKERFERTHTLVQARSLPLDTEGVRAAGRVITIRAFGRLVFATLRDHTGTMQIALQEKNFDKQRFAFFKKQVDIGDFVGVEGSIFKTKMGEITVDVRSFELLAKALRPLPEKWHGVQEKEILYRQRYLDLIMNEGTMERFLKRTRIIKTLRDFLDRNGFVEVETPVLQTKPSGAIANPFVTHHQALDMPLYLRIAPETYLKRCIAGGFDRVYEFARSFRNEGMDPSHLQDFTLLEYYAAYWNYRDNMAFTEELIKHVLNEVNGTLTLTYNGEEIDFSGEWEVLSMRDLLKRDTGIDIDQQADAASLRRAIEKAGIELQDMGKMGHGALIDNLYKKVSRPGLKGPLFLVHHPIELSPLARRSDEFPSITDRFQLVVNGWEIVNAYSELVDPLDQRARLEEQARLRSEGDSEAMVMDEDFLAAMEHGMPPMSGWGMGIDRFICLLTDQENLRDVILFPLMKPAGEGQQT
jgi:lysyl-tRNA synthetase class 2